MKKKIYVMQVFLLFGSIHIMIAWVADRKEPRIEQRLPVLPSKSTTKNTDKKQLSANSGKDFMISLYRVID